MPKVMSTARAREFGDALRAAMNQAGLTAVQAAEILDWDPSKISHLVTGKGGSTEVELALLLGLCRVPPEERRRIESLFHAASIPGWWQHHAECCPIGSRTFSESVTAASSLVVWHTHMIPDLVQTSSYAQPVLRASEKISEAELKRRMKVRLDVQNKLNRRNLQCVIYLHEIALRFRVDSPQTQIGQAQHLLRMAARPNISMRLLPERHGAHAGLRGPFTRFSFPKAAPLIWVEGENSSLIVDDADAVDDYDAVIRSLDKACLDGDESKAAIREFSRTIADGC